MRIGLRHHAPLLSRSQHQRVVRRGIQLGFNLPGRVIKLIAAGTVDLRHGAQAQCILGANAFALGNNLAAGQQAPQSFPHNLHVGAAFEGQNLGIKGVELAAQGFKAHCAGDVCPGKQPACLFQCQAGEPGHTGRAVHQAQAIFRA